MAQEAQAKAQGKANNESDVEELNNFKMLKIRTKEDSDDEYTLLWKAGQFQNSRGKKHSRCDSLNVLDECNNLYLNNSPKKRVKKSHLMHVLYGTLFTRKGTEQQRVIKILCNSGTSSTIISGPITKKSAWKTN